MSQHTLSSNHHTSTRPATTTARIEIHPGEGGEDAAAFAAELRTALGAWARRRGGTIHDDFDAGERVIAFTCTHLTVWEWQRWSGLHRIQRIPPNDPRGRRHTSTATVAVLSAAAATAYTLDLSEVRIDTFRGTGPGGQHRNKTDSSVRALHRPTGILVTVTRGRSQAQNRADALAELTRRLAERTRANVLDTQAGRRAHQTSAVVSKAFTHNTQRDEVVEHATGHRWSIAAFNRGLLDN